MKKKRVCMFVWNQFTNDARVTREAQSLRSAGYDVWIIAVHDHKMATLRKREKIDGLKVYRVSKFGFWEMLRGKLAKIKTRFIGYKGGKSSKYGQNAKMIVRDLAASMLALMSMVFRIMKLAGVMLYDLLNFLTRGGLREAFALFWMNMKFAAVGLKTKADIYHSHDLNTLMAGYFCSRKLKAKLIYDSHEINTDRTGLKIKSMWRFIEKRLIKRADFVIYTTYTRAKFSADMYKIPVPQVIGNYTDIPDSIPKVDMRSLLNIEGGKIVLYQGGLQKGRGLEQVIDAVPYMNKDVTVVMVGGGSMRQMLEQKVIDAGLCDRVKFTGKIPLKELLGYTACADVGLQVLQNICFNHYSTDSNKLFEYLTVGVPVVASDFPEIRKVVTDYNVGVLIDPHEPKNIADGVNKLFSDKIKFEEMKKNALKASRVLCWENEAKKFLDMYRRLDGNVDNQTIALPSKVTA